MKTAMLICLLFTTPVYPGCNTETQTEYLAKTMFHEARQEGLDAMQLVGEAVLTRVESVSFPDTICGVIFQKGQFSSTSNFGKSVKKEEQHIWHQAKILADDLITGEVEYIDTGATYFLNLKTLGKTPSWAKKLKVVGKFGSHTFYTDNAKRERIYFE